MAKGFLYLAVIMDWVSRAVLAWRLSNTLAADFCVEALEEALARYGRPEIFNTDQGSQFTSDDFTGTLKRHEVMISMDGKGRCMDNIFVERLWRSLKYEEVYLNAYATVAEAKAGIGAWLSFYNNERQHHSLGYRTPQQIYEESLWICGRSASPTGCASPASRASSESGEMLPFAHIPTGTTANKGFNIDDEVNGRLVEPAVDLAIVNCHRHRDRRVVSARAACPLLHRAAQLGTIGFQGQRPRRKADIVRSEAPGWRRRSPNSSPAEADLFRDELPEPAFPGDLCQLARPLHACSGCFRLERLPGGACTHWKAPPCHGAHPEEAFSRHRGQRPVGHIS